MIKEAIKLPQGITLLAGFPDLDINQGIANCSIKDKYLWPFYLNVDTQRPTTNLGASPCLITFTIPSFRRPTTGHFDVVRLEASFQGKYDSSYLVYRRMLKHLGLLFQADPELVIVLLGQHTIFNAGLRALEEEQKLEREGVTTDLQKLKLKDKNILDLRSQERGSSRLMYMPKSRVLHYEVLTPFKHLI